MERLKYGTRECQCTVCNLYFTSPTAFDRHREDLTCLGIRAMKAKGMTKNDKGQWTTGYAAGGEAGPAAGGGSRLGGGLAGV